MEFGNIKNKIADYLFNRERETSMTETLPNSSGQMIGKPAELKKKDFEMSYLKDRGFIMNTLAKKMPVVAAGVDRLAKEYDTSKLTVHNLPGTGPLAETRSGKFIAGPGKAAAAVMSQVKPEEAQAAEPEPIQTQGVEFTPQETTILEREPKFGFEGKRPVPNELWGALKKAANHTGMSLAQIRGQFGGESGETWDPNITGAAGEIGIPQLMPSALKEITRPRGKNGSYWEQNFQEEYGNFNPKDPIHQILGAAIFLNWVRKEQLPGLGIENPTDEQVSVAYNSPNTVVRMVNGETDVVLENGKTVQEQWDGYTGMLKNHGYYNEN